MSRIEYAAQTLNEAWDEYQSAPVDVFPSRAFELLFNAVKDIVNELKTIEAASK